MRARLAAAAVVLVAAGCSSGSSDGEGPPEAAAPATPAELVAAAPAAARAEGSVVVHTEYELQQLDFPVELNARVAVDLATGDLAGDVLAFGEINEIVVTDGRLYVHLPYVASVNRDLWASMRMSDVARGGSPHGPIPGGAAILELLSAADEVEEIGADTIGTQSATRYRITVDVSDVLLDVPSERSIPANIALGDLTLYGVDETTIDAWLSEDGLPLQVAVDDGDIVMTVRFSRYGDAVDLTLPAASEVREVSGLVELTELISAPPPA